MSEAVNRCWIGLGGGQAPKLCVGGGDATEMKNNIADLFGTEMVDTMLNYFANEAETSVHRAATQAAMDAGIVTTGPTGAAQSASPGPARGAGTSTPAAPNTAPPSTSGQAAPAEEEDQYGNKYTYNVPGAPSCPHGPRVRKAGKSRAGKDYVGWFCVTGSPYARRNNIPDDKGCKAEFSN